MRWRFILLAAAALGCGTGTIETADALIARHLEAIGGLEAVRGVRSRTSIGTYAEPTFREVHRFDEQRPNLVRVTTSYDPETGSYGYSEGFDGAAWEYSGGVSRRVTGMPATALRHAAEFDPPFIDHAFKGHTVELIGRTTLLGRDVYQLRVGQADHFFDAESFLYVLQSSVRPLHGEGRADEIITVFSDFRRVGGVLHPFRVVQQRATGEELSILTWDSVAANPAIPAEWFGPPPPPSAQAYQATRQLALEGDLSGLSASHQAYRRAADREQDRRFESELNALGYELISHERYDRAVAVFTLALGLFPQSANLYDSRGEAYLLAGDEANALSNYRRALTLNPGNRHAADVVARLEGSPPGS